MRAELRGALQLATWLLCLAGPGRAATEIHYTLSIPDPAAGVVEVTATIEGYPYPDANVILADPPVDATAYFAFFEGLEFEAGGEPLDVERTGVGMATLDGLDDTFTVRYRVLVAELMEALGPGAMFPTLSEDYTVLPLRAILPDLVEVEDRGLVFQAMTLKLDFPESWGILTPWRTYDRTISFAELGYEQLRAGIVCGGDFHIVNELDASPAWLGLYHGADVELARDLDQRIRSIVRAHTNTFASHGEDPFTVVAEVGPGPADVRSYGAFLRVQCPPAYVRATPSELGYGTDAYAFHHKLAHEAFHRWMGTSGIVAPLSPSVYWLSEGAADYLGALALAQTGITNASSTVDYLEAVAGRLRHRTDRALPVDDDRYLTDGAYRELVLTKGPLIALFLDLQLLRAPKEDTSFPVALRRMFYKAFIQERRAGALFSEVQLAQSMEQVMGLRGKFVLVNSVRGDVYAELLEKAEESGLRVIEEGDEVRLEVIPGGRFESRLAVTVEP